MRVGFRIGDDSDGADLQMPLTMQWQDLKDLLRPAGLIMRAE